MNIALPATLSIFFAGYTLLLAKTGDAFPGLNLLATRERNPRLFGTYWFTSVAATIGSLVWLAIAISQELMT